MYVLKYTSSFHFQILICKLFNNLYKNYLLYLIYTFCSIFFLQKINKYIVSTLLDHFYICRSVSFKLFDCRKSENLKSVNSLISRVSQQNCGVWTHPPSFFILVQYYYFISWNKLNNELFKL